MANPDSPRFDAVVFDLLTALLDSWTLWNDVAGSREAGLHWRRRYLEITYGCGGYRPYDDLVAEAARDTGLSPNAAYELHHRWHDLKPWPETPRILEKLGAQVPLGIATNCSQEKGLSAASLTGKTFAAVITAEKAGFYKPRAEVYRAALDAMGTDPARTLFVAGSAADVPGAKNAGMPVYWHNRIGLPCPEGGVPDFLESTLDRLPGIVLGDPET
ncbi:HAD family hydrolase [Dichotomicrobium thermohalophilum]|uniref:2-haloalkanoic acid dehalogenase type II n=1 Tax=Dichotomicrobium thermohalophilum TaxID=933063 RepID=A0A397Q1L1_9HYPH|nr:HAD-IA family hydrolase [Dichotomicrobium thermohalophilum]RIA55276.1 2-haloalkanoic acid dehalogenase type II [Dichotomicrobium thermohalophilum]